MIQKDCLTFLFHDLYSQIWLNSLMDDHHKNLKN
jgi:hypothetical protein